MGKVSMFNKLRSTVVGHLFEQFRSLFTQPNSGLAFGLKIYKIYVLLAEKLNAQNKLYFH